MDFPETRWTLIAHLDDEQKVSAALDQLCAAYWQPIYAYLVQANQPHARAQDLTQEFLQMMVRQRLLERADPAAGKLRSWLVAALHHFLANVQRRDTRQKRGADKTVLARDGAETLAEVQTLAAHRLSPDEAFDRAWVAVLLRRVLDALAQQYREAGKEQECTSLLPWLLDDAITDQTTAAEQAGMTIARFRVQLHRLRGRYRQLLRQEITATLGDEDDFEEELAYLLRITGLPV